MDQNPYQAPQSSITLPQTAYQKPTMMQLLFSFEGRIPRRVYWGVTLLLLLVMLVPLFLLIPSIATAASDPSGKTPEMPTGLLAVFGILFIPFMWISLAIAVKRWHDRGKSGWWILIGIIPYIGAIWSLVECGFLRGDAGDNAYGPDPT